MAHRWEALIDFPWGNIYFKASVDILGRGAAERMCVMLKSRCNKWSTQAKVGCLAHSVWAVCFLFWVEWEAALSFLFEARAPT